MAWGQGEYTYYVYWILIRITVAYIRAQNCETVWPSGEFREVWKGCVWETVMRGLENGAVFLVNPCVLVEGHFGMLKRRVF